MAWRLRSAWMGRHFPMAICLCIVLMTDIISEDSSVSLVSADQQVSAAPVANGSAVSPRTSVHFCLPGEVACTRGGRTTGCIPAESYCDGRQDCNDGSDEGEHCVDFDCGPLHSKCPNKRLCTFRETKFPDADFIVANEWYICNGVVDCRDGSDEDRAYCRSFNCSQHQEGAVKCPSGVECLWYWDDGEDESRWPPDLLCNGEANCVDGSDESASYCRNRNCSQVPPSTITGYIRCDGGRCITSAAFCNGTTECRDGSDERNCRSRPCPENFRKCKDGRTCVASSKFCDGNIDCPDRSDETSFGCPNFCPDWRKRRCADNITCVSKMKFCDGVRDCPDGSDESTNFASCSFPDPPCENSNDRYQCPSGPASPYCLRRSDFCDGYRHCTDGSDENITNCKRIPCPSDAHIMCRDGRNCITPRQQCDGQYDCRDRSDENPTFCRTYTCGSASDGSVPCPSGVGCMYSSFALCDGHRNCLDGSDETRTACANVSACNDGQVLCKSPRRCKDGDYCDGIYHCRDGSDEDPRFCRNHPCRSYEWRCLNNVQCIRSEQVCDGARDCADGSDEASAFCRSFNCSSLGDSRLKCPANNSLCVDGSLCDGFVNCVGGSDENAAFCRAYTCPQNAWKCGDRVRCIPKILVCDGTDNCGDNSDENSSLCQNWA